MNELKTLQHGLWILIVGEVFASFAHPFFFLGTHPGAAPSLLLLPGGAFSIVGGFVFLYFIAAAERATWAVNRRRGGTASMVILGALGCIPGVRVFTELTLLMRVRRNIAASVDDGALKSTAGRLVLARSVVQCVGVFPGLMFLREVSEGSMAVWVAVSLCPLLSLVLLLVVARMLTHALVERYQAVPALAGQGAAEPVAVSAGGASR